MEPQDSEVPGVNGRSPPDDEAATMRSPSSALSDDPNWDVYELYKRALGSGNSDAAAAVSLSTEPGTSSTAVLVESNGKLVLAIAMHLCGACMHAAHA